MTDPTPEERAREIACTAAVGDVTVTEAVALDEIRAAVEAENEACAMKAGACAVAFGSLAEGASEPEFSNLLGCERGAQYVAAAIRARGRTPSAPTQQQENDKP
jgi:hypothetical protein